jgi:hypothetical protein
METMCCNNENDENSHTWAPLNSYATHRKVFPSMRRTSAIQGAALMWEVKNLMNLGLYLYHLLIMKMSSRISS